MDELVPQINTLLIVMFIAVIPTFVAIAYALLRPWIVSRVGLENLKAAEKFALLVVRAVEQASKSIGLSPEEKKMMASNTLKQLLKANKIKIDEESYDEYMETLIEGSVQTVNAEQPLILPEVVSIN